jgi:hypothetical protein
MVLSIALTVWDDVGAQKSLSIALTVWDDVGAQKSESVLMEVLDAGGEGMQIPLYSPIHQS